MEPVGQASKARSACRRSALETGWAKIRGSALMAVVAAVRHMEDELILNAGVGACLNSEGQVELDAGVMEGSRLRAGAVAAVRDVRHPVDLALRVMRHGRHVLLVSRFDRVKGRRQPFLSAMSMLGAKDNESRSYLEFVDVLRRYGAAPMEDMEALWRRIVFTILISNTDDHLRNHAFLYEGQNGWRLSPAYDLNPVPIDIKPRVLVTAITEDDNTASLALAFEVAGYFEISTTRAREIAAEVAAVVSTWRAQAKRRGISRQEIDRMASAFEHRALEIARGR